MRLKTTTGRPDRGSAEWRDPNLPSTIEPICAFESKKHKITNAILALSSCVAGNKKLFQISDFCSPIPSLLVENSTQLKTQHSKSKTNIALVFGRSIMSITQRSLSHHEGR